MNPFDSDQTRLGAAAGLPPEHFDEFQRLSKTLVHGPAFQFVIVECADERLRKRMLGALEEVLRAANLSFSTLSLGPMVKDAADLEAQLVEHANEHDVVHVLGASYWFDDARWDAFNARRERVAQTARARLVFWLTPAVVKRISAKAPDLWAWRSGVYAFEALAEEHASLAVPRPFEGLTRGIDSRSKVERARRISELHAVLDSKIDLNDELRAVLLDELAGLHLARGEMDEALRIRRDEELPLYKKLGDLHAHAATLDQISRVLMQRGEFDEALHILQEKVLPVFNELGDVLSYAIALGTSADILMQRGELDEALRIYREEQLPVYEKLSDVRSRAATLGQIADVLMQRGAFDEALRIYRDEELPAFEKLGDARSRAITFGRIATVLKERGEFDEALRIHREEELPVYEKLGDMRERVVCMSNMASVLLRRAEPQDREEAVRLLTSALADATRMGLGETRQIADLLARAQGKETA